MRNKINADEQLKELKKLKLMLIASDKYTSIEVQLTEQLVRYVIVRGYAKHNHKRFVASKPWYMFNDALQMIQLVDDRIKNQGSY